METIVIEESLGKKIQMLVIMAAIAAACIWGIFAPEDAFQPHKRQMLLIGSAISLPFLAIGIVAIVVRIARPRPFLLLTEEGFEFISGIWSTRFVPWCEVKDVSLKKIRNAKVLCISLYPGEKDAASSPETKRRTARMNRAPGYSYPIQINMSMAKGYKPEEVVTMMRRYREESLQESIK